MAGREEKQNPASIPATGLSWRLSKISISQESWTRQFISNLRDFLTERPIKVRSGGGPETLVSTGFGAGFIENLKEWLRPLPTQARRTADSRILLPAESWRQSLWNNLRDAIAPRRLPPLKVTSKPLPVPEIWSRNDQFKRVQALSVALHVLLAVAIIVPLLPEFMSPPTTQAGMIVTPINVSPLLARLPAGNKQAGGGGGGGERNLLPASRGRLPKLSRMEFTPPMVKPPAHPKLAMDPSVIVAPNLHMPNVDLPANGDPLAKLINESNGPGNGAGIGSGSGGGVGSGSGSGIGPGVGWNTGGGYPQAGLNGYSEPECLYCPTPRFTDEAVKAKYQGIVVLQAVITPDGRAIDIHVAKGLGLGLDQNAIEAVRTWRFKPAMGPDGRPAAVVTFVEVTFRLF